MAREKCDAFTKHKRSQMAQLEAANPHNTQHDIMESESLHKQEQLRQFPSTNGHLSAQSPDSLKLPEGCKLFTSEPIIDRKSVFVGYACLISHPADVSKVIQYLLGDRKIAKATHPTMLAYRCRGPGGIVHQDNDDDVSDLRHYIPELF